ncbi:hypothetical protein D3C76_1449470 [compost metagenome]
MGVAGHRSKRITNMARHDLLAGGRTVPGGIEDALADQAAVCPAESRFFLGFAAGDHQAGGDLQLAQHVALLVTVRRDLIQILGRQAGDLIGVFNQSPSIGERRQTQAAARFELDLVDG